MSGAAVGGALEHALANGLPKDELFVYEDALRRGKSIVVAMTSDAGEQEQAATALEASGAESVDAARKQWWIGLRDAEALEYRAEGFDFERDEETYRQGFEAALSAGTRGRADREVVLQGLRELMAMPSAGDLVLYGIEAAAGNFSFVAELGAHAGPSEHELHTFILHPPDAPLPAPPITHPVQLYPHFAAYLNGSDA